MSFEFRVVGLNGEDMMMTTRRSELGDCQSEPSPCPPKVSQCRPGLPAEAVSA